MHDSIFPIQHDIDRLKKLGRFGGERLEYCEFSDGHEYANTLERVVGHYFANDPAALIAAVDELLDVTTFCLKESPYYEAIDRLRTARGPQ